MKPTAELTEPDFLYAQIADRIEKQITGYLLKTGDKLLSVRALSKEQGISLSTAFKAYAELENKGLIEARPKSGYFVRYSKSQILPAPTPTVPPAEITEVQVDEMISIVYKNLSAEGIVQLSLATPPPSLVPLARLNKCMLEALRKSPASCSRFEEVAGNPELRKQVAKYAFNWGGTITADDVITTHGCMEALVLCLKAVAQSGDIIAIQSPTYFGIFNVMKSLGLKVLEIPSHPITGIDLSFLRKAIKQVKIKACLFVTNFNNPSGNSIPDSQKKELVELLAAKDIPLIEDDVYGEMYFGKTRPRTCKSFDKKGLVMLCSSISKTLAPGYRVGWCIPGKFKDEVLKLKLMHTVSSTTPTQAAIGLFFQRGRYDLHMRKLRKALHTQCLRYTQAISMYFPEGIRVSQPLGGYVLWIEMEKKINAFRLFQQAIKQNISIAPGQIFSTDGRFSNFMRLSFGAPFDDKIENSLKIIGNLIRQEIEFV